MKAKGMFKKVVKGAKRLTGLDRGKSFDKIGDIQGKHSVTGSANQKARVKKRDALHSKQNKRSIAAVGGTMLAVGGYGAYDVAKRNKENASLKNRIKSRF